MVIMSGLSAGGKKSGEGISEPESAEDIDRSLASVRIGFGVKQRHSRRQTVIPPHLQNVRDQFRLLIQVLPRRFASVVRIMLERHKRQILQSIVGSQIVEKSPQPRGTALCIGPRLDVFCDALKRRTPEFETRVHMMKSAGKL